MRNIMSFSVPEDLFQKIEKAKEELKIGNSELFRQIVNDFKFLYEFMGSYMEFKSPYNWDSLLPESQKRLEKIKEVQQWI